MDRNPRFDIFVYKLLHHHSSSAALFLARPQQTPRSSSSPSGSDKKLWSPNCYPGDFFSVFSCPMTMTYLSFTASRPRYHQLKALARVRQSYNLHTCPTVSRLRFHMNFNHLSNLLTFYHVRLLPSQMHPVLVNLKRGYWSLLALEDTARQTTKAKMRTSRVRLVTHRPVFCSMC